ncbi:DUF2802 domain-containing protein [Vibrio sp. RC27]
MVNLAAVETPIILGVCLVVVLVLFVIIGQVKRSSMKQIEHEKVQREEVSNQLIKTNKQLLELRSVVIGLGQKVTDQQELLVLLNERLVELEQEDTDSRLYSRASKLVKLGADIDEVISECELPQAEAELMYSLQQKLAGKEKVPPLSSLPERLKSGIPEPNAAIRKNPRS